VANPHYDAALPDVRRHGWVTDPDCSFEGTSRES